VSPLLTRVNFGKIFALSLSASWLLSIGASAADSEGAVTTRTGPAPGTTTKAIKPKEDLPNFHKVHPFLYRGGEPSKEGLRKMKDMGITTIFDLRNPGEKAYDEKIAAKELGLRYISMPMNSKAPTQQQIKKLIGEIDKAKGNVVEIADSGATEKAAKTAAREAVFVHCAHGSDRTGCMIGIWRVMRDGYDYDTAYQEMRKYWFTPKFTNLSGAVRAAAGSKSQ